MSVPYFFIFNPNTGEILRSVSCDPATAALQTLPSESIIIAAPNTDGSAYYIDTVSLVQTQIPARLSEAHIWNWATKQWVYDIDLGRSQVTARIKAARDSMEFGPLTCDGNVFDGDAVSRGRLGVALEGAKEAIAAGDTAWTKPWKLANNTAITLTAPELLDVVRAHGDNMEQAHVTAAILAYFIDAATTPEELEAIQWPT